MKISESLLYDIASNKVKKKIKALDPVDIISKIIDAFIKILLRIWREFEAICMNLISKATNINKYKEKLLNINIPIYYSEMHYNYSNTGRDTSATSFRNEMDSIFNDLTRVLDEFSKLKPNYNIGNEINKLKLESDIDDVFFDNMRGKILGSENLISAEDYGKALNNYFRSGGILIDDPEITSEEIRKRAQSWVDFKSTYRSIKKDKIDMENCAKNIQKKINNMSSEDYIDNNIPQKDISTFTYITFNYSRKIKEICNIFVMYFTAKMDAAKEEYSSNNKILFKAAQEIVRKGM